MQPGSESSARGRRPARRLERSFAFRGGVRLVGTHVTCDAAGPVSDLVFLSDARALDGRSRPGRGGRQQILTTEATLALLGRAGEALRRGVLPAPFGRPFLMGDLRLELLPAGHLPGGASLLCQVEGRRVLYAGAFRLGPPALGAVAGEVRDADAVCLDATYGDPAFVFPPLDEALADVVRLVRQALAAGCTPVVVAEPFGGAMDAAAALAAAGIALRGSRAMVAASSAFRAAGAPAPVIGRWDGKLPVGAALLWPLDNRQAPLLGTLPAPRFILAAAAAADPRALAAAGVEAAVPLSNRAGHPELLAYVETTGAREVALWRGRAEALTAALRARGCAAYLLGPPQQMELLEPCGGGPSAA